MQDAQTGTAQAEAAAYAEIARLQAAIAKAKQGLATSTQERQQQDEGQQEQSGQHSQHSQQHPQPTYHAHPPYRGRGGRVRGTRAHPQSRGGSTRYPSSYSYSAGAPSSSTSSSIPFKYHHHSTTKPVKKNLTWTAPPGPTPAASEPAAPTEHDESESVVDQTKASASGGVIVAGKDAKGATNNDTAAPDAIKAEPQQPRASASYRTISGSRHRKLVLNGQPTSTTPRPPADTKTSASRAGREVVIGGVTFISDKNGRKLVRRDASKQSGSIDSTKSKLPASSSSSKTTQTTPSKTSVDGQSYVRTKSGNLISVDLVKKREMEAKRKRLNGLVGIIKGVQKARSGKPASRGRTTKTTSKTLCRYFQKTGMCTRGLTCPYVHDSNKVAICPRFLRNKCTLTASTCPLSHDPSPHRMPHCSHFPNCTKPDCPYAHVHVAADAKICKDFVNLGWCEKGLECKERHVWECPEFSETGVCTTKGCKLPHIIRRRAGPADAAAAAVVAGTQTRATEAIERQIRSSEQSSDVMAEQTFVVDTVGTKRSAAGIHDDDGDDDDDAASGAAHDDDEGDQPRSKKVKLDSMQANDDFVTLVISETEEETGDEENEDADSDNDADDDVESGAEDQDDDDDGDDDDAVDSSVVASDDDEMDEGDTFLASHIPIPSEAISQTLSTSKNERFRRRRKGSDESDDDSG